VLTVQHDSNETKMPREDLYYVDLGGRFDDRNVLRIAAGFTTAQRVEVAHNLLARVELTSEPTRLAFLAIEALERFVLATEDALGWFFTLLGWEPGAGLEKTLFAQLDTVQVGRDPWNEERALELLNEMDLDRFRAEVLHLPTDDELNAAGWQPALVGLVGVAAEAQMDGFRNVAERRARGDRALVRAYNKSKHMLLAFPAERDGALEVDLITASDGARAYRDPAEGLEITGAQLSTNVQIIRERVQGTITMHAVLHAVPTTILAFRFGEKMPTPDWVTRAGDNLEGWVSESVGESPNIDR
jgi:hypothetical protein